MSDKRERAQVRMTDFYGVIDAMDDDDIPAGAAQKQVNCAARKQGLLQTRRGYLPVSFENSIVFPLLANNGYAFHATANLTAGGASLSGSGTFHT